MKNLRTIAILFVFLAGCSPNPDFFVPDDDFYNDLASEDNRIAAVLLLDMYNNNLSTLTYESYITFLSKNEAPSAKGLAARIQNANAHFFAAQPEAFRMVLYYKDAGKVVGDWSGNAFIDTVFTWQDKTQTPDLHRVSERMGR